MEVDTAAVLTFFVHHLLYFCFGFIKSQSDDVSTFKILKEFAQKCKHFLEDKKYYIVEKVLALGEFNNGELEFLTKWEGYTKDQSTWENLKPSVDP